MISSSRSYVLFLLVVFMALACINGVLAAPMAKRQIGDITCNVDRLKIVGALAKTTKLVKTLSKSQDATTASGAQTALTGLSQAQSGIDTIAGELLTLQTASAAARDQVQSGLTSAQTALAGITAASGGDATTLSKAQSSLASTISAGQGVVANCK